MKHCLEGGTGTPPQAAKYLVYKLPAESSLIGTECVICLEEFTKGSTVARLSCLCSFHYSEIVRQSGCPHMLIVSPSSLPVVMAATRTELPSSCTLGNSSEVNQHLGRRDNLTCSFTSLELPLMPYAYDFLMLVPSVVVPIMLLDIMPYCYTLFVTSHIRYIPMLPQFGCLLLFAWYGPRDPRFINTDDSRQVFVIWLDDVLAFNAVVLVVFSEPCRTAFLLFLILLIIIIVVFEV